MWKPSTSLAFEGVAVPARAAVVATDHNRAGLERCQRWSKSRSEIHAGPRACARAVAPHNVFMLHYMVASNWAALFQAGLG